MADKSWKAQEREIAARLGGRRKLPPIFCYECGSRLETQTQDAGRYDDQTGQRVVRFYQWCAKCFRERG